MNYLAMCQALRQEVGASGNDLTVTGATKEWANLCNWTAQAWTEIQQLHNDWNWMRKQTSFTTVAEQGEYPYASAPVSLTDFGRWKDYSFRIYKDTIGDEHILEQWDYDDFRDTYLLSTTKTSYAYPSIISISPSDSLWLALPPDDTYTVTGEYYTKPSTLSDDSDIPEFPERFHMMIVYQAMIYYGEFEERQGILRRGERGFSKMLDMLESDELPTIER